MSKGITRYSKDVPGTRTNWNKTVRFDLTDGCLGISQWEKKGGVDDRVLLNKSQVAALLKFIGAKRPVRKPGDVTK